MNPLLNIVSVLAQIESWIPDIIAEDLACKYENQTRSFSADNHVMAMLYAHLAPSLSMNDICNSLHNHADTRSQVRCCTPPPKNDIPI